MNTNNTTIMCYEKWDIQKLNHIKSLDGLPKELQNQLNNIQLSEDGHATVRYSTKRGDIKGRFYGNIIITRKTIRTYRKRIQHDDGSYEFNDYERESEIEDNGGVSLQGLSSWIRRIVSHQYYRDYDISNCAPTLLEQILRKNNLTPPKELIHYNENRNALYDKYSNRLAKSEVKKAFLVVMHLGNSNPLLKETIQFRQSLRSSLLVLSNLNDEYKTVYNQCKMECMKEKYASYQGESMVTKILGKFCAIVWNRVENVILMCMREYFHLKGYDRCKTVLCFDGLMVEKPLIGDIVINLDELSDHIYNETDYRVKIEEKSLEPTSQDLERSCLFTL